MVQQVEERGVGRLVHFGFYFWHFSLTKASKPEADTLYLDFLIIISLLHFFNQVNFFLSLWCWPYNYLYSEIGRAMFSCFMMYWWKILHQVGIDVSLVGQGVGACNLGWTYHCKYIVEAWVFFGLELGNKATWLMMWLVSKGKAHSMSVQLLQWVFINHSFLKLFGIFLLMIFVPIFNFYLFI